MLQFLLSALVSFGITFLVIPLIILFSRKVRLYDKPGGRKIHEFRTPTLGGVAIFIGFIVAVAIWAPAYNYREMNFLYGAIALLLLVFIGVRDDVVPVRAVVKLIGQLVAAFMLVQLGGVQLTGLHGLFGVHEVPQWLGYVLTILTITTLINAFNLMDGVNGLAGSIGFIASAIFGTWFFLNDNILMFAAAASLCGALLAFLKYNLSPAKIFMGDTGSMLLGFVLAVFAIQFIEYNAVLPSGSSMRIESAPMVALGVLIVPIFDMFRLIAVRSVWLRTSPFKPDRNHMHHLLMRLGLTHNQITLLLSGVSILAAAVAVVSNRLGSIAVGSFMFLLVLILGLVIDRQLSKRYPGKVKKRKVFK